MMMREKSVECFSLVIIYITSDVRMLLRFRAALHQKEFTDRLDLNRVLLYKDMRRNQMSNYFNLEILVKEKS